MDSVIIFCAKYLIVFVVLGLGIAWLLVDREAKKRFIVATIVAGVAALILSRIASKLYFDPRPFVTHHVRPLIAHGADNGFPSDHALFSGVLTAITFFFHKRIAWVMLALSVLIGAARVLAHVHSPLDIVGAWVFAVIGAVVGYYAARWMFGRYAAKRPSA